MPAVTDVPSEEPAFMTEELGNGDVPEGGKAVADLSDDDMPPLEDLAADGSNKGKRIVIEDEEPKAVDEDGWLDILGSGELKKKVWPVVARSLAAFTLSECLVVRGLLGGFCRANVSDDAVL